MREFSVDSFYLLPDSSGKTDRLRVENAGVQHRPPHPNLLPQAIGRKTPDKRNRSTSAMARPAS